jgi:hypothetical protein
MNCPECVEAVSHSKIKCKDGSRWAVVRNPQRSNYRKYRVDGCVIKQGIRADWVIERAGQAAVIELKGVDTQHAADQVYATAEFWLADPDAPNDICGLIICKQFPKTTSSMQVKINKFATRFKRPLHVVTHNGQFHFAHLFSFKGPFKE